MDERKTWQHDFEEISELQLRLLLAKFKWLVDRWGRDYGEDLFVRIFKDGVRTGNDFYIQLKGTDNTKIYELQTSDSFSYPVDLSNLRQWSRLTFPVIFVLWDISGEVGYWLHVQPYISAIVETKPDWLKNQSDAKDPTRNIHIPRNQILNEGTINLLTKEIDQEYKKISLGKQHIEEIQRKQLDNIQDILQPDFSALLSSGSSAKLPPQVQKQIEIANYQAIVANDPQNLEAWLELDRIYYELGEMDKALAAINKVWELNQTDLQVINARACTLAEYAMLTGQPRSMLHEAIELFESIKDHAHPATVYYNVGNCYSGLKEYEKAIQNYDQALNANPSPGLAAQIWKNRGTAFFNLENYDEEELSYKEALRLNPGLWEAYASWGGSKADRKKFVEASELLEKAFQVNPALETYGHPQLYWLAYSLASSGNYRDAYLRVNQMLLIKPDSEDGSTLKAHILSELWRTDPIYIESAIAFYKERILDNTEDSFARSELYLIYNSEGYNDEARSTLEDSVDLDEVPVQLLYRYALLLESEQKLTQAIAYLEEAVKVSQEHHIVHNLARMKKKVGDYQNAIKYYNMALRDVSEPFSILRAISDCYYFLGDFREAAITLAVSILLGSTETDLWGNLTFALDKLGLERHRIADFFSHLTESMLMEVEQSRENIADKLDEMLDKTQES
jgi:tetratricopeptide (TPR) repeat protein